MAIIAKHILGNDWSAVKVKDVRNGAVISPFELQTVFIYWHKLISIKSALHMRLVGILAIALRAWYHWHMWFRLVRGPEPVLTITAPVID